MASAVPNSIKMTDDIFYENCRILTNWPVGHLPIHNRASHLLTSQDVNTASTLSRAIWKAFGDEGIATVNVVFAQAMEKISKDWETPFSLENNEIKKVKDPLSNHVNDMFTKGIDRIIAVYRGRDKGPSKTADELQTIRDKRYKEWEELCKKAHTSDPSSISSSSQLRARSSHRNPNTSMDSSRSLPAPPESDSSTSSTSHTAVKAFQGSADINASNDSSISSSSSLSGGPSPSQMTKAASESEHSPAAPSSLVAAEPASAPSVAQAQPQEDASSSSSSGCCSKAQILPPLVTDAAPTPSLPAEAAAAAAATAPASNDAPKSDSDEVLKKNN